MRDGSRSRCPSPSTSIPTSMTRTSCIRSTAVCRMPSEKKDDAPWRGRADAPAVSDNTVADLVDPATARGERHRLADGLVDRQRPERAEAVPDGIDVDGGDPLCRQRSGEKLHVLLTEGGSVTDDRHGPTILGHRSGRQREVKVDLVGPLQFWRSGPRPNRRDVLAGMDLVV